jgi:DNA-binding beta-propeller fold protein YncE
VSGDIQDIVANPARDVFYIINSHSDRVRIYNADRFRLEPDVIELGNSPGNFVVRPDGLRAFGAINSRNAVAIVNLETNEMVEYVGLNFPPYAMCFNKEGTHLYVASRDSASVVEMDTETDAILRRFDLPARIPGLLESTFPEMIGVSSDENYLYVLPKRSELVIYDISVIRQPDYAGQPLQMVQSTILPTTPFYMQVVRGLDEGEIPQADQAGDGG